MVGKVLDKVKSVVSGKVNSVKSTESGDYDFIILGGGGSGLAAGMYGARLGLNTLILGFSHGSELPVGGVITTTNIVENYPGFTKLTGQEIAKNLESHARSYDKVTIKEEKATEVKKLKSCFVVKTAKGTYKGKAILFATGTKWKKLPGSVKGAKEFENKGVNYCALCQPPGQDIIGNSSLVQIEKVTPSTRVLTRDGSYQKIGGFSRREYKGDLIKITPRFFTEPVMLTPNHPVLITQAARKNKTGYLIDPEFSEPEWKQAEYLQEEDCVLYPIVQETKDKDYFDLSDYLELRKEGEKIIPHKKTHTAKLLINQIPLNEDFCRLVGYYLAEGSSVRHDLRFYFNKNEKEYIDDVSCLIKKTFGLETNISYRDQVCTISAYSKVIADLFKVLFDKYSYKKSLPHFMLLLPEEKQKQIIRGLWRGDGCIREKDFCLVTNSKKLVYQVRDILLRLGVIPSIQLRKKEDLNEKQHKIEGRDVSFTKDKYHLTVGGQFLERMSDILGIKHPKIDERKKIFKHAWINDKFAILPIRKIEREPYEGEVLSIGVEENNSYVAKNFIVHNCDGPLFADKIVGLVGGGDSAAKDAMVLAEHAKKVYIINRSDKIHPEPINFERVKANKKIEVINNTNITEVKGDSMVTGVTLDKPYNGSNELAVGGLFVAIGHLILSELAKPLGVKLNKKGEIMINHMDSSTNVPGVFAAGDVADKPFKQLITGVAEGCTAAHSAYEYITKESVVC